MKQTFEKQNLVWLIARFCQQQDYLTDLASGEVRCTKFVSNTININRGIRTKAHVDGLNAGVSAINIVGDHLPGTGGLWMAHPQGDTLRKMPPIKFVDPKNGMPAPLAPLYKLGGVSCPKVAKRDEHGEKVAQADGTKVFELDEWGNAKREAKLDNAVLKPGDYLKGYVLCPRPETCIFSGQI